MSKLEVKEITPISGETDLKLGQSGGTVTIPSGVTLTGAGAHTVPSGGSITIDSGATITNNGTAIGFGDESPVKAWVKFDGTNTVSIYQSSNVSSITDYGAGYYGINFSTAMPDNNYSIVSNGYHNGVSVSCIDAWNQSPSEGRIRASVHNGNGGAYYDLNPASVIVVR